MHVVPTYIVIVAYFFGKNVFRIVIQILGFYSSNYGVEMKHLGKNFSIKICQSWP